MAGPTASVLLNILPSDELITSIYNIIDTFSYNRENNDFYIPESLVSSTNTELKSFGVEMHLITPDYYEYSEKELNEIKSTIKIEPKFDIRLYAMSNDIESHEILGFLCLKIAETANGIIDFGGLLEIKLPINSGNLYTISYELASGGIGYYNICDTKFMKYWLEHEKFRMVK